MNIEVIALYLEKRDDERETRNRLNNYLKNHHKQGQLYGSTDS